LSFEIKLRKERVMSLRRSFSDAVEMGGEVET
jgi:hypothetical protein